MTERFWRPNLARCTAEFPMTWIGRYILDRMAITRELADGEVCQSPNETRVDDTRGDSRRAGLCGVTASTCRPHRLIL